MVSRVGEWIRLLEACDVEIAGTSFWMRVIMEVLYAVLRRSGSCRDVCKTAEADSGYL
jgi:hypothetical protein